MQHADHRAPDTVELVTERLDPRYAELDQLSVTDVVTLMNQAEASVPEAVAAAKAQIVPAIEATAAAIGAGGRLFYVGAGTPGRIGALDAAECPPTFSTPPETVQAIVAGGSDALRNAIEGAEDDPDAGAAAMVEAGVRSGDVVVGIAASGRTPFVIGAVTEARRLGAKTVGLSCNPDAALSAAVDFPIEVVVGPEVIAGSTRLKAGSAQKQVLNMFSTITMIRNGKTYGNLMVDLNASNAKLRARARSIVEEVAHVSSDVADAALDAANLHAPTAIVMLVDGVDAATAAARLQAAGGRLRQALEQ